MKKNTYLSQQINPAPLIVFRIGFGLLMLASIVRFWFNGWIEKLYLEPKFHFSYYGFNWVKPIGNYTYLIFFICGLSALFVALGLKYRLSIIMFFFSFTYIELMDKTTYLNHYYFISIVSFLLIFLPANACFSLDNFIAKKRYTTIPKWTIDSIKLALGIVYFYAGLAKINSDWLFRAMPLKIWLPSKYDLPFIGNTLLQYEWFHYAMSWLGMFYDLLIPFLLLSKKARPYAYFLVLFFHVFTRILFPIGMFPFVMIVATLIYFEVDFHKKVIAIIKKGIDFLPQKTIHPKLYVNNTKPIAIFIGILLLFQVLFPWRYLCYPGELFWTEEGFRFSWRVMLMEKAGNTTFRIVNSDTGASFYVNNSDFLTPFQEKQMSFQPDFILEYAHFLGDKYKSEGINNIEVYADSYVALNGRLSTQYINPKVDLYKQKESFKHKKWIIPFNNEIEIKGL